jgi:type II secretory pathway predicted ATPase ExeA
MSFLFRLAGLLVVLLVLGWLARTQLSGRPSPNLPTQSAVTVPSGTPRQIQQQYKDALEHAMQAQRRERSDP